MNTRQKSQKGRQFHPAPNAEVCDGLSLLCPWCRVHVNPRRRGQVTHSKHLPRRVAGETAAWTIEGYYCPMCEGFFSIVTTFTSSQGQASPNCDDGVDVGIVYPRATGRAPAAPEVPQVYRDDYLEACLVLQDSPQSSAALSRRILQAILLDPNGVDVGEEKNDNLYKQVDRAAGKLPEYILKNLHLLRQIGNIAAHQQVDPSIGIVVKVDPEEAEFGLNVVAELFEFCFVQKSQAESVRSGIQQKLTQVGKPGAAAKVEQG